MVTITGVIPNSPADRAGIANGDVLVSMNGHAVRDVLDYMFYAAETQVQLVLERGGEMFTCTIDKDEYDDLGLRAI